jgi:osmotically inducible protein OsmC
MATRNGSAEWHGNLEQGSGQITVGNGAHTGPFSYKSRFEDGDGTNPEELLAAALAGCFSMALSLILGEAGHPPDSIRTSARAQLRPVDGAPTITQMAVTTEGVVPGIDQEQFVGYATTAKEQCVISRAIAGVEEITLDAKLAS